MLGRHLISILQFLITIFTVAMTLALSKPKNVEVITAPQCSESSEKKDISSSNNQKVTFFNYWKNNDSVVKFIVIGLLIFNLIYLGCNFWSNSHNQKKLIEKQVKLINNIAKLAYELVTNEKKKSQSIGGPTGEGNNSGNIDNSPVISSSIRILVLIHYKNSWYRRIVLFCYCLLFVKYLKREFYKDRFVTIAGYNHQHVITDGIPFSMKSTTGKAYIEGRAIREKIEDDDKLGSSNQELGCVLATPIVYNGCSVGTLNIDSSDPDSSVCSLENSETLERFAKIIAEIIGNELNGYRSYVAKRYRRFILKARKIERSEI